MSKTISTRNIKNIYYEIKNTFLNRCTNQMIHTYKHLFRTRPVLYVSSSHKSSKSMTFVFGGVQKHFDSTHLSRHSTSSSWSLQNLITCPSMQALAKSITVTNRFLLRYTWVFSLVVYIPSTVHWQGMKWVAKFVHFTCDLKSSFR